MKIHLTTPWLEIIPIVPWFYTFPHPSAAIGMWHFISMSLFSYLYNVLIIEWTWRSYSENRNETCSGFKQACHTVEFVLDKLLLPPKTMTSLECNWSHQISIKNGREFRGSIHIPLWEWKGIPPKKTWSILSNMRIMMHRLKSVKVLGCLLASYIDCVGPEA